MNTGSEILRLRRAHGMTQEEFGSLFHVTRQAVSNWENGKSYPDLQILVEISSRFGISLDALLKGDASLVRTIDRQRESGRLRRESLWIDRLTGAGTGMIVSCLFSPDSGIRTVVILAGLGLILAGWCRKARFDRKVLQALRRD